jgi:plasmid maintenance system killer protein
MDNIVKLKWAKKMDEPDSKLVSLRDGEIENQMSMDVNKAKRILSKYLSLYKV